MKPGTVAEAIAGMLGRHLLYTHAGYIASRQPIERVRLEAQNELDRRGLGHWLADVEYPDQPSVASMRVWVTRRPARE